MYAYACMPLKPLVTRPAAHLYACAHMRVRGRVHACVHVRAHVCMRMHVCTYACICVGKGGRLTETQKLDYITCTPAPTLALASPSLTRRECICTCRACTCTCIV